ncbi:endoglucanase [Actinoplanes sp. N902-109]|nr:endoglucanase [Actinoplanes sp. N902-109]
MTAFCAELRHLTQRGSLSATAAARRLHISRSQYYAIINGEVRRPPDWAKVEVILRLCEQSDAAVADWRQRHDAMVLEYDRIRARRRAATPAEAAPATPTAPTAPAAAPPSDVEDGHDHSSTHDHRRRPLLLAVAVVVVLAVAAVIVGVRLHGRGATADTATAAPSTEGGLPPSALPALAADGTLGGPLPGAAPEPGNPADPNERAACVSDAPPPGTELLTVPKQHRPGNNKMNHDWWGSGRQISWNAAGPAAFDANVAPGTDTVWGVIILHSCVPLVAGHRYVLRFTAASSPAGPVTVRLQDSVDPENNASYTRAFDYAPVPHAETVEFTALRTSRSSEVTFQVGGRLEAFRLRVTGISLVELS